MGNSKKIIMGSPIGLAILVAGFASTAAYADAVYNDIPAGAYAPGAPDFSNSVPFAEDEVSEFGALVQATGAGGVNFAQVALSNWGTAAQYATYIAANPVSCGPAGCTGANATGFYTDVTLSLYNTGASSVDPSTGDTIYAVGSQFATVTADEFINWRPASTPGDNVCTDGLVGFGPNSQCGSPQVVGLPLATSLPSTPFIYGVSFATDSLGDEPSDSLNLGLNPNAPTTGTNPQPDTAYYNALCTSILDPVACTSSAGSSGFVADTGWGSIGQSAVSFSPEPATFGLIGLGLLGFGFVARKKNGKV